MGLTVHCWVLLQAANQQVPLLLRLQHLLLLQFLLLLQLLRLYRLLLHSKQLRSKRMLHVTALMQCSAAVRPCAIHRTVAKPKLSSMMILLLKLVHGRVQAVLQGLVLVLRLVVVLRQLLLLLLWLLELRQQVCLRRLRQQVAVQRLLRQMGRRAMRMWLLLMLQVGCNGSFALSWPVRRCRCHLMI